MVNTNTHKKWKRILLIVGISVISFVVLIIIFISPITKYLIEKYDVKFTGREIKMSWVYVNPFTGYIHLSGVEIFEEKSSRHFLNATSISANFSMLKMLSKTYEISSITIDKPIGVVVKNLHQFNFDDIVKKFSKKDKSNTSKKPPVKFNILDMEIIDGIFYYKEPLTPINYFIKKFNFKSKGKYYNIDSIAGNLNFESGVGSGKIIGNFIINTTSLGYKLNIVLKKFDLNIIEQYLKNMSNYGTVKAFIDADLRAIGNFKSQQSVNIKGKLAINDFHFGKTRKTDYASFSILKVGITELDPEHKKFYFDSVLLAHPYFNYERYDYLDNYQRMFGAKGSAVKVISANPESYNLILEIAKYVKVIFKNFLRSNYKVNNLNVADGDIQYKDYAISEKFVASLNPFNINSDSIDNTKKQVKIFVTSAIKPFGSIALALSMNTKSNKDFDLNYQFKKIPIPLFNPYILTYTSFPLDRGTVEINGNWSVRNDFITSTNHIIVIDPRLSKKIKKVDMRWIPMPLIMFVVRERGNVIDYEVPITGNLKDPKFNSCDVIKDAVSNIFIKPVTTPYRYKVANTENEIEKSMHVTWALHQAIPNKTQKKFLNKIADFLQENPSTKLTVTPTNYIEKEKEYILFFEAKKKYFIAQSSIKSNSVSEADSINIEKIQTKNAAFVKYVNKNITDTSLFTLQEKCYKLVGEQFVNEKYNQLLRLRKATFMSAFKDNKTNAQINVVANKNEIPMNGFSYYKINYKGNFPEELSEAFEKLAYLNSEAPRNRYRKYRKSKGL